MQRHHTLSNRLLKALLFGRFEPIETVLALSAVVHGLWMLFPYWSTSTFADSITGASRPTEIVIGICMALLGMAHLASMAFVWSRLRRHIAFVKFLFWGFLTWLAAIALGLAGVLWIPYLSIMLISGFIYLNISIGVENE